LGKGDLSVKTKWFADPASRGFILVNVMFWIAECEQVWLWRQPIFLIDAPKCNIVNMVMTVCKKNSGRKQCAVPSSGASFCVWIFQKTIVPPY
jgi:hypothetical protein